MASQDPDDIDDRVLEEVPEDVAVLYSWAHLQGSKYRDFSASRREFRAQMRKRAAEAQREAELRLKVEAEAAAAAAERAAHEADEAARFHETEARRAADENRQHDSQVEEQARARAMQHAAELNRRANAERVEASRRAEAVAAAEAAAQREAREMTEARASAERQAARYAESEAIRKARQGPQPEPMIPGQLGDPYLNHYQAVPPPERVFHPPVSLADEEMKAERIPRVREERVVVPQPKDSAAVRADQAYWASLQPGQGERHRAQPEPPPGQANYYYEPDSEERAAAVDQYAQYARSVEPPPASSSSGPVYLYKVPSSEPAIEPPPVRPEPVFIPHRREPLEEFTPAPQQAQMFEPAVPASQESSLPAWLNAPPEPIYESELPSPAVSAEEDLQHSRERVAARWYALKGVLDHQGIHEPRAESVLPRTGDTRTPLTAVFSISGGVGKTSMVATLGRALSSLGEHVLLADTTLHGLLPFYFGATELHPGVVRAFSPRSGASHAPVAMVSLDLSRQNGDASSEEWLNDELARAGGEMQRILLDLSPSSPWAMRRIARLNTLILVPVSPDMNSVISLGSVERFFAGITDSDGRAVQPFYVLNGFDASLPLHLDVREVMRQQLGGRLLPFVIRRSPAIAEALAEGMTVMDYAPESAVAGDYMNLASWLRTQSSPAGSGFNHVRWSER